MSSIPHIGHGHADKNAELLCAFRSGATMTCAPSSRRPRTEPLTAANVATLAQTTLPHIHGDDDSSCDSEFTWETGLLHRLHYWLGNGYGCNAGTVGKIAVLASMIFTCGITYLVTLLIYSIIDCCSLLNSHHDEHI